MMHVVSREEEPAATRDLRSATTRGPRSGSAWAPTATVAEPEPEPEPGEMRGRYRIGERLGAGGMGVVFAAHDTELDRDVALKLLRRARAPAEAAWSEGRARLLREAQALAQLSHPHVVEVYDVGTSADGLYIAMAQVHGPTLRSWLRTGDRDWRTVVRMFLQAGRGLAAAHAAGLVHRDFKPTNVLVDAKHGARVVDFGLALPVHGGGAPVSGSVPLDNLVKASASGITDRLSAPVTEVGLVMGTPAYMAPEQHTGAEIGPAADQYAFCASLYEGLYGHRPFVGDSPRELLEMKRRGRLPPDSGHRRLPAALRDALRRGLAPRARNRWPSMDTLLEVIEPCLRSSRARMMAAGAVTLVVASSVGAVMVAESARAPCTADAVRMASVWGPTQREAVYDALMTEEVGYAADTAGRVERGLDDYAQRWDALFTELCRTVPDDTPGQARRERQLTCMRRVRGRAEATIEVLANAESPVLSRAASLVGGLPAVAACTEDRPTRWALPDDPRMVARVRQIEGRLEVVKVLIDAGRYDRAYERASQLDAQAQDLGVSWLEDRTGCWLADAQLMRGEFEPAEARLVEIVHRAEASGHDQIFALALTRLVYLAGRAGRSEEGLRWARHGEATLARVSDDPLVEADLRTSVGSALLDAGQVDQGARALSRAVELWTQLRGSDDLQTAVARTNLGIAYAMQGRYDAAIEEQTEVLRVREMHLGPEHPDIGVTLNNLANAHYELGGVEQARELQLRTYSIWRSGLGAEHPNVAIALNNLANTEAALHHYDDAVTHLRRAIALRERALGPEHPELATSRLNLGVVLGEDGQYEPALAELRTAHRILDRKLGDHPWTATGLAAMGVVQHSSGDVLGGRESIQSALAMGQRIYDDDHPALAAIRYELAKVLVDPQVGQWAEAEQQLETALEVQQGASVSPEAVAETRWSLAQVLRHREHQPERARGLAEQARDYWRNGPAHTRDRVAQTDAWLARPDAPQPPPIVD